MPKVRDINSTHQGDNIPTTTDNGDEYFSRSENYTSPPTTPTLTSRTLSNLDAIYMRAAAALAKLGGGFCAPNPQVGCIIARDGNILGVGYHTRAGAPHAEREALRFAQMRACDVRGATAYVTLEPCNHTGKTPPCTDALIESGITRVVVGSRDPNPLVSGAGIAALQAAGVDVDLTFTEKNSVLFDILHDLNAGFFSRIVRERPYITAKFAMSLDGKIATHTGDSRWITGTAARAHAHIERARADAIVTSVGTVLADDPALTARIPDFSRELFLSEDDIRALHAINLSSAIDKANAELAHQPLRIVCDTHLKTPLNAQIISIAGNACEGGVCGLGKQLRTVIATANGEAYAHEPYLKAGAEIWVLSQDGAGHVDVLDLARRMGQAGINNVILEGGPTFMGAWSDAGLIDCICAYIAPKIIGGQASPSPVSGLGVADPNIAPTFPKIKTTNLPPDTLITAKRLTFPLL